MSIANQRIEALIAERDGAVIARDHMERERNELRRRVQDLERERKVLLRQRGAILLVLQDDCSLNADLVKTILAATEGHDPGYFLDDQHE